MSKKYELSKKELQEIQGGVAPIMVAIGLGSLAVASFSSGYKFGTDLARRGRQVTESLCESGIIISHFIAYGFNSETLFLSYL